jgi:PAS domain S-box-containing protein
MKALSSLSLNSKISLGVALVIMIAFFIVQTCIVFGLCEPSLSLAKFGWGCVVFFMPPFFKVVLEFTQNITLKEANINMQLKAIDKSNLVVILDMQGYILKANNKFCNVMKCEEKELLNQPHYKMVPEDYAKSKEYIEFWETLKQGKSVSGEFERISKNGDSVWLFGNYTPIQNKNGDYTKVLKIATDITTQHKAEIIVNQKNSYLEHAAKILRHDMHSGINTYMPRGLNSLKRRLKKDQIKELKIDAPLKMLEEGLKHTQKVYAGVKEFTNLVKEEVQLDKQPHNLKEILSNYLSSTSYGKQVAIDELPTVEINEPLFCTAIDNLIRNGLKYNDNSTKIVTIYMENDYTLCVEDNGRGITQEEFVELSQPYTRKEGQKEGGSGLGLNICIAILKEHNFEIKAEKVNPGTKLKIKIK